MHCNYNYSRWIAWEEVQTIPSISGVEPDISVCQDILVAKFRCGKVIQEISAIFGTLKGNTVTWHRVNSTCGYGHNPSVSINSGKNIVAVYQIIGRRLSQKWTACKWPSYLE